MTRIVVTGASGRVGQVLVEHLLRHGYEVTGIDRVRPATTLAPYRLVDLENLGGLHDCFASAEAVIHLAALQLGSQEPTEVFRNNVMATYNVFEAASRANVSKVVFMSSKSVLGYPAFHHPIVPQYVPIDEQHPLLAQDPYALSKLVCEEIAQAFVNRRGVRAVGPLRQEAPGYGPEALARGTPMAVVSLRPTWILTPETFAREVLPLWRNRAAGAAVLWCYVDIRDVAQACRLALEARLPEYEAFYIAAANSFMNVPTVELVRQYFPTVELRPELAPFASLLSSAKATRLLGYQPEYRWEDYL